MNDFLTKIFIKDYKDVKNPQVRHKYCILSSVIGCIANILLFTIKIIIGFMSNSISIIADAFNNLTDVSTSIILYIVSKLSSKPADKKHPFGHGRLEYISSLIISFFIIMIGLDFIEISIKKITNPEPINTKIGIIITLVITIIIKLWLAFFNRYLAKQTSSTTLKSIATDSLSDSLATFGTVISLIVTYFFNVSIDGYVGVVVAIFIIYAGYSIAKETITILIGTTADPQLIEDVKNIITEYDLISGVHEIAIHNYGPNRMIGTAHAEISMACNLFEAHKAIDDAEKEIKNRLNVEIVIHADPL